MKNLIASTNRKKASQLIKCYLTIATICLTTFAKANASEISQKTQNEVINSIAQNLQQGYVFPEKAKSISKKLQRLQKAGHFRNYKDAEKFSAELTKVLQDYSKDKHLQVEYNKEAMPLKESSEIKAMKSEHEMAMWRAHNFGFEKLERLPFNIGYFKLSAFGPTQEVGPLIASTMNLLNNSNYMIIDLRGNFGGEEKTVQLLTSYFFDEPTHLLDMYKRKGNQTIQHWSSEYVDGARYSSEKDVYILIDSHSFSAAEDFSYTMKHLKRATLIGENTGGAANSGDFVQMTPHFSMFLPTGRAISPITQTNWEGKGVIPNIPVAAESALKEAQKVILNKISANETNERRKKRIQARISSL